MPTLKISDGQMSHVVKTKEEAECVIDRYFPEEKEHVHMIEFRKPVKRRIDNKLLLATLAQHKNPVYKIRQLQALCYISLVLNIILLSVVLVIL